MINSTDPGSIAVPARAGAFRRVIAGIDFSPASLAGARWALTHLAAGADVLFAHVVPFEDAAHTRGGGFDDAVPADSWSQMAPTIRGGLGGFAATLDIGSARTVVRVGRPSYWLDRLAAGFGASLIVLGRRRDARRKRIGEASVVGRLTRRSPSSVLVVPEGIVDEPRCILAAVDEGSSGEEVLAAAMLLSSATGLPLIALHVLAPASGAYDRILNARGSTPMTPAQHCLTSRGERLTLAVGDAAREIVAAGLAHGGGLLVVGKRGADDAPVGSLGSVAREVLETAPLAVLAIDTSAPWLRPASETRDRFEK